MTNSSDLFLMQQMKKELTPSQLQQFMMLYPGRKKSVGVGIAFSLLLGFVGAQWFYLGNTTRAVIYLLCGTVGFFLVLPPLVLFVLCIVDACRMGSIVSQANNIAAMNLKEELKLLET